jgi:molecular chaperone GrpE (heat shock protein)
MLLAIPAMATDEDKPLPQESQVKMLKAQREIQAEQARMADLQKQFDTMQENLKKLHAYMENECTAAAKKENVDLTKYNCDVDTLKFVPKLPAQKKDDKK